MKFSSLSPLILLTALGSVWAAAEPPLWRCLPRSSSGSSDDCAQALRKLPSGFTPGKFHTGSPADEFQLPKVVKQGSCEVTIQTVHPSAFPVTASWLDVFNLANSLMANCGATDGWKPPLIKTPFYKWYTGGSIRYGDAATGLKLDIKKSAEALLGNATAEDLPAVEDEADVVSTA
ncbi:MAG: hypothetical protein Q9208_005284 [Pyrenodesmia sp. 3 TL-2023]